ncbi:hypothetical protein QA811_41405 [Streptomyces sp. B21-102]|uniref:hypothetical protein n=1 Tax=Streptomyces sp. B21-102 TaxID=3039416 RepID=UPI002FEFE656
MQSLVSDGGVFVQAGAQYEVGLIQDVGPSPGVRLRIPRSEAWATGRRAMEQLLGRLAVAGQPSTRRCPVSCRPAVSWLMSDGTLGSFGG